MTELTEPNCIECHQPNVFTEHVANRTLTCSDCHSSTDQNVQNAIANGMNGTPVPCQDCHGASAGDHLSAHNMAGTPSTGCTNCHDANVVTEHVTNRGFSCSSCHNSTDSNVLNAINSGKNGTFVSCYDCHGQGAHHNNTNAQAGNCTHCHADPRPLTNDPQQLACRECHIDNNGFVQTSNVAPSHAFNTNGNIQDFGACFACHAPVPYHAKPTVMPESCDASYAEAPGKGSFNLFYSELGGRNRHNGGEGRNERNKDCKDRESRYNNPAIAYYMFKIDYQGQTIDVPAFDKGGNVPSHSHSNINTVGNCGNCHTVGAVVPVTHNNNCQACHFSTNPTVQNMISQARTGTQIDCFDCHGSQDHVSAHDLTELTEPNCIECHVPNVFSEHVVNRSLTCSDCHSSTDQNVQNAIANGMNGAPVPCQDCHGASAGDHLAAHDNAGVPSTGCTNCHDGNVVTEHVTNRTFTCATCHDSSDANVASAIDSGKSGTFVSCYDCHGQAGAAHHDNDNARTGNCTYCHADPRLDVDPNAPTGQLACRQCHVDNSGFVSTSAGKPSHAFNTSGNIQDFGACFDCHQPTPYHAKPSSRPSDCFSNTAGKGTFNLFSSEYGGGGEHHRFGQRNDNCEGRERDYENPSISFNMVTIVDQLGTNQQWTVPTFGSGGTGGGGGSQNDSVNITYATYSSRRDRLTVYAENTLENNATLYVMYDGESYEMGWDSGDNRWEVEINASRCRDSSIEVESSAGGSDSSSVSNCSGW